MDVDARPQPEPTIFHGLLGRITNELAPHSEGDPVGILASLMSYYSAAIGGGPHVRLDGPSKRPLTFWPLLCGITGDGRKGTGTRIAAAVYKRVSEEFVDQSYYFGFPDSAPAFIEGIAESARAAGWIDEQTGSPGDSGELDPATCQPLPSFPMLFVKEEWADAMDKMKMSSKYGEAVRMSWEGSDLMTHTMKRGKVVLRRPHVAITAHITPDEFQAKLSPSELSGGTFNRFTFLFVHQSRSLPRGGQLGEADFNRLAKDLGRAVRFAKHQGKIEMQYTEDAWRYYERSVYGVLDRGHQGELMRKFGARALEQAKRLAALYALADQRTAIEVDDLKAGEAFARYCFASVKFVMAAQAREGEETLMGIEGDARDASEQIVDRVMRELRKAGPRGMRSTALYRKLNADKEAVEDACAALGSKVVEKVHRKAKSGPGSITYRLTAVELANAGHASAPEPEAPKPEPEPERAPMAAARSSAASTPVLRRPREKSARSTSPARPSNPLDNLFG
ncbi:DUF3987 domain-containing protein [Nonomuraea sp. NPDC059007]|uniref:DUF3987 domain-containing protein n=1 Tax=Nonomuraea sp. NPDC059007 TaxID=3346692 RepID=UPI0036C0B529